MKLKEFVYLYILTKNLEGENKFSQREISELLKISLTNVHAALKPLRKMSAVRIFPQGFELLDREKVLLYWANFRNLYQDIIWKGFSSEETLKIESSMPASATFTAYSAFRILKKSTPADYSEVYVYCNDVKELSRRFQTAKQPSNIFALKKDSRLDLFTKNSAVPLPLIFVDIWNLPEWYAKEFLKELKKELLEE